MNPQLLALLTAAAWGIGGYFEKKGLHLGGLSPQMGITIRTAVALIVLGIVSFPQWKTLPQAGPESIDHDGHRRRNRRRIGRNVMLLCRHQRRAAQHGHANRVYLSLLRCTDGNHRRRRTAHLENRHRCPVDSGGNYYPDHLIPSSA